MIVEACVLGAVLCGGPATQHVSATGSDRPPVPSAGLPRAATADSDTCEAPGSIDESSQPESRLDPDVDFSAFLGTLGWNLTRGLVSTDNLLPLAIGGGAALAVHPVDDEVTEWLRDKAPSFDEAGHLVGHPVTAIVSVTAALAVVPFTENRRFHAFAFTLAQAQILDSTLTFALKTTVSRTRPNGENDRAFPSGHTSTTFTTATVATRYYGWKVGVPAYAIATLVGASRIEKGKHYLSDVVFGATIGYIAGRTAVRGTERSLAQQPLTLLPVVGRDRTGLVAQWTF